MRASENPVLVLRIARNGDLRYRDLINVHWE